MAEIKSESNMEGNVESGTESKTESKAESKMESIGESGMESKTESKVESKAESKQESKVESRAESKAEIKSESRTESKTKSNRESKAESKAESRTEEECNSVTGAEAKEMDNCRENKTKGAKKEEPKKETAKEAMKETSTKETKKETAKETKKETAEEAKKETEAKETTKETSTEEAQKETAKEAKKETEAKEATKETSTEEATKETAKEAKKETSAKETKKETAKEAKKETAKEAKKETSAKEAKMETVKKETSTEEAQNNESNHTSEAAADQKREEKRDQESADSKVKEKGKSTKENCNPKLLDLVFAMDCTGSMSSYIQEAQRNIRIIVEEIVAKEHADIRLALVEYRDHPPQDRSFVTRVHDFTGSVKKMKGWLAECKAGGGGDQPEAVADALHQVLKLSWRVDAVKICVFISDAPPHGLGNSHDGFPNGCPSGLDPMVTTNELAEKGVTIYLVGCEPAILPHKEFFSALAHITGGQYIPLSHANLLSKVIVGGAAEELSLQQLLQEVEQEVQQEVATVDEIDEAVLSQRLYSRMQSRGVKSKKLYYNNGSIPQASAYAQELSYCSNMKDVRGKYSSVGSEDDPRSKRSSRHHSSSSSPATTESSRSKPATGGGIFSSLSNRFSRRKSSSASSRRSAAPPPPPPPACAMVPERHCPEMYTVAEPRINRFSDPTCSGVASKEENHYSIVEGEDIAEEQVSRLVQKAVMSNRVRSKVKRRQEDSEKTAE